MLIIRFQLESCALFVMASIVSTYQAYDNTQRNGLRNACRLAHLSEAPPDESCGYGDLPIRNQTLMPWHLRFGLGVCEEFSNSTDLAVPDAPPDPFVKTPTASFCATALTVPSFWLGTFCVVGIILWINRLPRLIALYKLGADRSEVTAADYAVRISGLDHGVPADEMEATLRADLASMGVRPSEIDHVCVAARCREEVLLARRLAELKLERQEAIESLAQLDPGASQPPLADAKSDANFAEVREKLSALKAQERSHRLSTGDAFVAFRLTATRDTFLRRYGTPDSGSGEPLLQCVAARLGKGINPPERPEKMQSSAQPAHVMIAAAPEPSDVLWENIEASQDVKPMLATWAAILLAATLTLWLVVVVKHKEASVLEDVSRSKPTVGGLLLSSAYSLGAAGLVCGGSVTVQLLATILTPFENHRTQSAQASSLFLKLLIGMILTQGAIPMALGIYQATFITSGDDAIDERWYEPGGTVDTAAIQLIISSFIEPIVLALDFPNLLLPRLYLARGVVSQLRLNRLWLPPPIDLALIYAMSFKVVTLGLLYGAVWPPAYLLSAVAQWLVYFSTKFSLAHTCGKAPALGTRLANTARHFLPVVLFGHIGVFYLAAGAASSAGDHSYVAPCAVSLVLLIVFEVYRFVEEALPEALRFGDYDPTEVFFDRFENNIEDVAGVESSASGMQPVKSDFEEEDETGGMPYPASLARYADPTSGYASVEELEDDCLRRSALVGLARDQSILEGWVDLQAADGGTAAQPWAQRPPSEESPLLRRGSSNTA
jgi:hypothetical protein